MPLSILVPLLELSARFDSWEWFRFSDEMFFAEE